MAIRAKDRTARGIGRWHPPTVEGKVVEDLPVGFLIVREFEVSGPFMPAMPTHETHAIGRELGHHHRPSAG
jgi:hypothetical protein